METQALFNQVKQHLLTQQKRSVKADDSLCMYRSPDGLKCAVGALIPESVYDDKMEGRRVQDLVGRWPNVLGFKLKPQQLLLLNDLQRIHDAHAVEEWPHQLRVIAEKYDLKYEDV